VRKNLTLKLRGAARFCAALEVLVPVAFVALLCLPRALIADERRGVTLHRPVPLRSLTWSGRLPRGGAGATRLVFSPSDDPGSRAVAEAAALELLCGPAPSRLDDDGRLEEEDASNDATREESNPPPDDRHARLYDDARYPAWSRASFARQLAFASALDADAADVARLVAESRKTSDDPPTFAELASSLQALFATCAVDPDGAACRDLAANVSLANVVAEKEASPPSRESRDASSSFAATLERVAESPLLRHLGPACTLPCRRSPRGTRSCAASVDAALGAFLVGANTAEDAERVAQEMAAGEYDSVGEVTFASSPAFGAAFAVVNLPEGDARVRRGVTRRIEYVIRVNASDVPTGHLGAGWARAKFQRWVVGEDDAWKKYWTYANVQAAFDAALGAYALGGGDFDFSSSSAGNVDDPVVTPSGPSTDPAPPVDFASFPLRVYGYALSDPTNTVRLYQMMRDATDAVFEVERDGTPVSISISLSTIQ
jgi:hypothetical protein